jgi:hypothetical protein
VTGGDFEDDDAHLNAGWAPPDHPELSVRHPKLDPSDTRQLGTPRYEASRMRRS